MGRHDNRLIDSTCYTPEATPLPQRRNQDEATPPPPSHPGELDGAKRAPSSAVPPTVPLDPLAPRPSPAPPCHKVGEAAPQSDAPANDPPTGGQRPPGSIDHNIIHSQRGGTSGWQGCCVHEGVPRCRPEHGTGRSLHPPCRLPYLSVSEPPPVCQR